MGSFQWNRQVAEHADQSVESAVEIFPMHFKECFDIVFYAILWTGELDCTFHYVFDEREKAVGDDDALWIGIMACRYEMTCHLACSLGC